ncbi:ABC transporter ATP-binding protein [Kribbella sp. NPDC000426]|uniref:ABC transporter ATP-binding protein n=1 Tax=Kribbella sp. NPDC000426 TaxID=3154255 RepID=UPI00332A468D
MRRTWRAVRVALGFGFHAAPRAASWQLITGVVFELSGPAGAYGAKVLVDAAIAGDVETGLFAAALLAVAVGTFIVALFFYVDCVFSVIERAQALADKRLMELLGTAELAQREQPAYLDEVQRIREERDGLGSMVNAVAGLLRAAAVLVVTSVLLARVDPVLLVLVAVALVSLVISRRARDLRVAAQEATSEPERLRRHLFDVATSSDSGKELRIFGLGAELRARHHRVSDRIIGVRKTADRKAAVLESFDALVSAAAFVGAIVLIIRHAVGGTATPGDVVLVIGLAGSVGGAVVNGVAYLGQFFWVLRVATRLVALQDRTRIVDQPTIETAAALSREIQLENVSFAYPGSDRPVIDDLSLELPAGSVVALVGENGAGKTSLVKLLSGFYRPDSGRITVDGTDLADVPAWWQRVSGTYQDYATFEFLARETVGVADLDRLTDRNVLAAMERAGATDVRTILPRGLDTQLGSAWDDGVDLSGGQWQKLALARGLMRAHPALVVFDEPTAALDPPTEHALFEQIASQARRPGTVTLLISHRFSTVTMADLIVVLSNGKILETGTHQQLINSNGTYAELYHLQATAYR